MNPKLERKNKLPKLSKDVAKETYRSLFEHIQHLDYQVWGFLTFFTAINGFMILFIKDNPYFQNLIISIPDVVVFPFKAITLLSLVGIAIGIIGFLTFRRTKFYTYQFYEKIKYLEKNDKRVPNIFENLYKDMTDKCWLQRRIDTGIRKTHTLYFIMALIIMFWLALLSNSVFPYVSLPV